MSTANAICDLCGCDHLITEGRMALNSVFVCSECVDDVITIHLHVNPVKFLCPHCSNKKKACNYCSIKHMVTEATQG